MNKLRQITTNVSLSSLAGPALAALVSITALWMAAGIERQAIGLAVSPFALHRMIVVHALATLPLSWTLARALLTIAPVLKSRWMMFLWVAVGVLIVCATVGGGGFVEHGLNSGRSGYAVRLLVRVLWCLLLQTPCYLAAQAAAGAARKQPNSFALGHLLLIAGVVAVAVPVSYVEVLLDRQTAEAMTLWREFRILKAQRAVQRLYDLGSTRSFGATQKLGTANSARESTGDEVRPALAWVQLQSTVEYLEGEVQRLRAGEPTEAQRISLAQYLVALDRTEEAKEVLAPLAGHDPTAAIRLAKIFQAEGDTAAAEGRLQTALKLAQAALKLAQAARADQLTEENIRIQAQAYDLLARSAGERADYGAAEQYCLEAIERLPSCRADFHYRLGRHYEFVGRPFRAVEHLQLAAELDPQQYDPPQSPAVKFFSSGTPIGLFRPASSRYKK